MSVLISKDVREGFFEDWKKNSHAKLWAETTAKNKIPRQEQTSLPSLKVRKGQCHCSRVN